MDLDAMIASVKRVEYLPENDLKKLCEYVKELMLEESNVQPVYAPVTVCGDIHGQYHDFHRSAAKKSRQRLQGCARTTCRWSGRWSGRPRWCRWSEKARANC